MTLSLRSRPFSQTLFIVIVLLIVGIVCGITVVDYRIAEKNLRDHQHLLEEQTEIDLNNSIHLIDSGLKLFDDTMNVEMEKGLNLLLDEYLDAGGNPSLMDLDRIKRESFSGRMDLYIINASNFIQYTTYSPDLDLDFGQDPEFAAYLDRIRNTSGFYPDRVVREPDSGLLRKYAYTPTPDHRYILELGMTGESFREERQRLKYTETIRDIKSLNPYVDDVRLFTLQKDLVGNRSFVPDAELTARLDQAIRTRSGFELVDEASGRKVRYRYIDLYDERYGSDISMIVELAYTTRPLTDALSTLVWYHALVALGALGIGLLAAGLVSGRLTGPIRSLVDDVDAIAQGDLDHAISPTPAKEFSVLTSSINTMVGRLKGTIEQLRHHEASLSESEDRYRRTLALVSDYAFCMELGPDGTWNSVWTAGNPLPICGRTFEELEHMGGLLAIVHDDDRNTVGQHTEAALANRSHESEFRIYDRDGTTHWVSHRTMPVRDPLDGRVTGYYAAGQDITARKRNEAALRESEEKYRQLVEDANSIILRLGPDGRIWYMNEYAERFFGYGPGEILGRDAIGTIVPEVDTRGERTGDLVHGICQDVAGHTINLNENMRRDGSRAFISWTNRQIVGEDGTPLGILCVGNDITRLREAEEENHRLYAELEERVRQRTEDLRQAISELESFTYTVSHDLRSPLRAIDGYTYILLHEHQDNLSEPAKRYLDLISTNARRMARLIDDLLNFARTGRGALNLQDLDPSVVVREVINDLAGEQLDRRVEITIGDLPRCRADPALLKQVYSNLVANALKFTRGREVARIEIGAYEDRRETVYFVRDNGVGFDAQYAPTLFKVFSRLHSAREYEGTGVGLAIVQRIIERHDGRVWVESTPEQGATFFFILGQEGSNGTTSMG